MLTLKKKQSLTVHQILKRALSWINHPYDATRRQQRLLRVVGKAGVGKSHLIKAIVAGMERKHEVILLDWFRS
jgi:chromosomal replication initiation ATPase DnaA